MSTNVKTIPEGYHSITPYLYIKGASKAIEFYKNVFGAKEKFRMENEGRVTHAELEIGDSVIMLADEHPDIGVLSPKSIGGTPLSIMLYIEDVDSVVNKAVAEGAKLKGAIEDKFYGDRMGSIEDPFGHIWHVSTHIEDVSPEEMEKRMAKAK